MSITRDEVAHLARLSRLALTEDELDQFAGQLDVIIGAVARVQEVAADGIPPTSHAVPSDQRVPRGRHRAAACAAARRWPGASGGAAAGSGCRGSWRRTDDDQRKRPDEDDRGADGRG